MATAEDAAGVPIGGVAFRWSAREAGSEQAVVISAGGEFTPSHPATYRVVAEAAGYRAEATVTAVAAPIEQAAGDIAQAALVEGEPTWDDTTIPTLADPVNQRGDNPLFKTLDDRTLATTMAKEGAGSGNFQLSIPLLDLPGRGLDVVLAMTYNSRFWHPLSPKEMAFVPRLDSDWEPGWSLNFAKIHGRVLFDADGTRHVLEQGSSGTGPLYTTDGSFIDCYPSAEPHSADVQCRYPTAWWSSSASSRSTGPVTPRR